MLSKTLYNSWKIYKQIARIGLDNKKKDTRFSKRLPSIGCRLSWYHETARPSLELLE
jgi:hypothetical protein